MLTPNGFKIVFDDLRHLSYAEGAADFIVLYHPEAPRP